MDALVFTAPQVLEMQSVPTPAPDRHEVLLSVHAAGICGSDMHAWHGHDLRRVPPMILGHEACGTIIEDPSGQRMEGQRVVFNPLIVCLQCDDCLSGRINLCSNRSMIGMNRPGAFAQQVAIPRQALIAVPEGMADAHAALCEPCATVWHALNKASRCLHAPLADTETLVIGGGGIGVLAALLIQRWGGRVRLAERNPKRRLAVQKAGIEVIAEPPESAGFGLVFDAVGSAATRRASIEAVRTGGVIAHVGLQEAGGDFDARALTLRALTFLGIYTYTHNDLKASLAALHRGDLGDLAWVESRTLHEGAQAFSDLHTGTTAAPKVVLLPTQN